MATERGGKEEEEEEVKVVAAVSLPFSSFFVPGIGSPSLLKREKEGGRRLLLGLA